MSARWSVIAASLAFLGCFHTPPFPDEVPERHAGPVRSGDVEAGLIVFEQTCAPCHVHGYAPDLDGLAATPGQIRAQVREGVDAMPAFPRHGELSDMEMEDLLAYLQTLGTVREASRDVRRARRSEPPRR